jgi:hypothetical protein
VIDLGAHERLAQADRAHQVALRRFRAAPRRVAAAPSARAVTSAPRADRMGSRTTTEENGGGQDVSALGPNERGPDIQAGRVLGVDFEGVSSERRGPREADDVAE